ncbi:hypothetical protein OIU79_010301 [Salix purpurea]|uniref:Uncharacterized protein n=1 Tax=Salix purpurea TaxID=77065 RepID=A0A9Q0QFA5_SALPP|nr:hypothetical protein OIU79_010301 [Salix purpurea]
MYETHEKASLMSFSHGPYYQLLILLLHIHIKFKSVVWLDIFSIFNWRVSRIVTIRWRQWFVKGWWLHYNRRLVDWWLLNLWWLVDWWLLNLWWLVDWWRLVDWWLLKLWWRLVDRWLLKLWRLVLWEWLLYPRRLRIRWLRHILRTFVVICERGSG